MFTVEAHLSAPFIIGNLPNTLIITQPKTSAAVGAVFVVLCLRRQASRSHTCPVSETATRAVCRHQACSEFPAEGFPQYPLCAANDQIRTILGFPRGKIFDMVGLWSKRLLKNSSSTRRTKFSASRATQPGALQVCSLNTCDLSERS